MNPWLLAFVAWTLLAFALGVGIGMAIRYADAAEPPEALDDDTAVIDWNERPAAWL